MKYRLIAHEIRKKQHDKKTEIKLRETLLPRDSKAEKLVEELRSSFKRNNPQGAKFRMLDGDYAPLQSQIVRYSKGADLDNTKFIKFTEIATRKLRACMEDEPASVGGYLVFAEYEYSDEMFLVIVLLSAKSRVNFDTEMNLKEVSTLDIDHVRHGARFRHSGVKENVSGAAQIVAKSSEGNFFRTFVDCETTSDSRVQANLLRTALSSWGNAESLDDDKKENLMRGTYGYWATCRKSGANMTLAGLANSLYPNNPDKFLKHLTEEGLDLEGEFPTPRQSDMKQFQKFSFFGDGLKIEFDRVIWQNRVKVKGRTVTITDAPDELLKQMLEDGL